ncbi:hypothetical protein Tco_0168133 [Tanacetum coccineum]
MSWQVGDSYRCLFRSRVAEYGVRYAQVVAVHTYVTAVIEAEVGASLKHDWSITLATSLRDALSGISEGIRFHNNNNEVTRNIRSNNSKDGLDDLVNKLDNLERDMKKLKESVHAIQVGCPICDESHLDKDCPLNEEVKQVEEVVYGEFGRTTPFEKKNEGKFHVGPPGYYTKIDNRPPYGKKRQSLKELLAKHQEESA